MIELFCSSPTSVPTREMLTERLALAPPPRAARAADGAVKDVAPRQQDSKRPAGA